MPQAFIAEFVDAYINQGLKPIPLQQWSKRPIGLGWNKDWSPERCRADFDKFPGANIGILLGDVVDVEGDDAEANNLLNGLIGDYRHPTWRSSKSVHHLFLSPDPDLTRIVYQNVEFRGHGHQSVVPPSFVHKTKAKYEWLKETSFPVPAMPEPLLQYYKALPRKRNKKAQEEIEPVKFSVNHRSSVDPVEQYTSKHRKWRYDAKPGRQKLWCGQCGDICFVHKKRFYLEIDIFRYIGLRWICNECRTSDFKEWMKEECRKQRRHSK
jgi:hypothetical protein